jgi:(E)-4-hydroxy-3-methylbut-2-enyl-diphosphate synthase
MHRLVNDMSHDITHDVTQEGCPFRDKPVIKYLGHYVTPELVSCPTCGRTHLRDEQTGDTAPFIAWVEQVEAAISTMRRPLVVAVMGCEVNGPGEARQADVGIAIGKGRAALFKRGEILRTVPLNEAIPALLEEIERTW